MHRTYYQLLSWMIWRPWTWCSWRIRLRPLAWWRSAWWRPPQSWVPRLRGRSFSSASSRCPEAKQLNCRFKIKFYRKSYQAKFVAIVFPHLSYFMICRHISLEMLNEITCSWKTDLGLPGSCEILLLPFLEEFQSWVALDFEPGGEHLFFGGVDFGEFDLRVLLV